MTQVARIETTDRSEFFVGKRGEMRNPQTGETRTSRIVDVQFRFLGKRYVASAGYRMPVWEASVTYRF